MTSGDVTMTPNGIMALYKFRITIVTPQTGNGGNLPPGGRFLQNPT